MDLQIRLEIACDCYVLSICELVIYVIFLIPLEMFNTYVAHELPPSSLIFGQLFPQDEYF